MLNRYLLKDINSNFLAIGSIFLLLIIGNKTVDILKSTNLIGASLSFLLKLIALNIPFAISLILPLAFIIATMLAIMRLSASGEFVVMLAGGKSYKSIFSAIFINSLFYVVFGLFLTLYLTPLAQNVSFKIIDAQQRKIDFSNLQPKIMQNFAGKGVYINKISADKTQLQDLILLESDENGWQVIKANKAKQVIIQDKYRSLVLEEGKRYKIPNKNSSVEIAFFKTSGNIIGELSKPSQPQELQALNLQTLIARDNLAAKAQVQWRLALPSLIIFLVFSAFPLSLIEKRNSSYVNILPILAIIIISIFACFALEKAVASGTIGLYPGIFSIHIALALLGFVLTKRKKVFAKEL